MRSRVWNSTCCALRILFAERVPGTIRSGWPAWETAQVQCASDVTGDLAARVTCEWRALALMVDPAKASTCCDAQSDDKAPGIVRRKGGSSESQTATLAVQKKQTNKKKQPCYEYTTPARMW